jgi:signal transduction histidine kinase
VAGTTLYVFRGVVAPLVRLTAASQTVGDGGSVPLLPGRRDELGALSRVLAGTTERLVATNAELQEALALTGALPLHRRARAPHPAHLARRCSWRSSSGGSSRARTGRRSGQRRGARRQAQRLSQLVGELLDVTRIQRGRLDLHVEQVRLDQLVHEVCERCAALLDAGQNRLTLELEPEVLARWIPRGWTRCW